MDTNSVVKKLGLLGIEVISYNTFAIHYKQNGLDIVERLTQDGKMVRMKDIDEDSLVVIGDNFVFASKVEAKQINSQKVNLDSSVQVYVKDKDTAVNIDRKLVHEVHHLYGHYTPFISDGIPRESEIILCVCKHNKLYLVNYKGEVRSIGSSKLENGKIMDNFFVDYCENTGIYMVGYSGVTDYDEYLGAMTSVFGEEVIVHTDKDFIKFERYN